MSSSNLLWLYNFHKFKLAIFQHSKFSKGALPSELQLPMAPPLLCNDSSWQVGPLKLWRDYSKRLSQSSFLGYILRILTAKGNKHEKYPRHPEMRQTQMLKKCWLQSGAEQHRAVSWEQQSHSINLLPRRLEAPAPRPGRIQGIRICWDPSGFVTFVYFLRVKQLNTTQCERASQSERPRRTMHCRDKCAKATHEPLISTNHYLK